jgi:ATP-dependent DNA helicase RecQ
MSDLLQKFGVKKLRDFQEESVDNLLERKDVYLSVKTGGGKSLCYQDFHVFWTEKHGKNGNVLVISPLISIMK